MLYNENITKKVECLVDILMYFDLARKRRLALLDLLIAASQEGLLTDLDIRDEVNIFLFAVGIFKIFLVPIRII